MMAIRERDPKKLVRVDTLAPGQRFIDIQGSMWTYLRRDGALSGVYHVKNAEGHLTAFAGCAEVEVV